MILAYF